MAASAATDSTERSIWPAMMTRARPIDMTPSTLDCLDDVGEDAGLEIIGNEGREDRQDNQQHEPDEIVEDEFELCAGLRCHHCFRCIDVKKGLRVLAGGSDQVTLIRPASPWRSAASGCPRRPDYRRCPCVMAAPGILMFGPQASIVTVDFRPSTSYSPGLISCLSDDLVHEHGNGGSLCIERLFDFDVAASPCGSDRGRRVRRWSSSSSRRPASCRPLPATRRPRPRDVRRG